MNLHFQYPARKREVLLATPLLRSKSFSLLVKFGGSEILIDALFLVVPLGKQLEPRREGGDGVQVGEA
jgi:hypothetical protein